MKIKKIIAYKTITKAQIAYYLENGKAPKDCAINLCGDVICIEPLDLENINLLGEFPKKDYTLVQEG